MQGYTLACTDLKERTVDSSFWVPADRPFIFVSAVPSRARQNEKQTEIGTERHRQTDRDTDTETNRQR